MKKFFIITIALFISYVFFPSLIADAHPGRTDANGGHICRTNCEKWGLEYGEYHYHDTNKNTTTNSNTSSSTSKSAPPKAPSKPAYTQQDINDGNTAGKQTGYDAGYAGN